MNIPPHSPQRDERLAWAEGLLREAVYRSRALQAASSALAMPPLAMSPLEASPVDARAEGPAAAKPPGRCGLGERAAVSLDLSAEGERLFVALWPATPDAADVERIRGCLRDWVVEQDTRDRKRNHFLKAFRLANGFDRTRYSAAQIAEFDAGLARINADEDSARRAAAQRLIGA